jgi:predicted PurR-regulated permease PerM
VSRATQFTVQFILNLFVMLYALFFFLVGGRQIMARLLYLMPLSDAEESRLVAKGMSVTRATLKGTFIIGIIQGGLAGIAFAIAGIKGAAFWGTIMGVLSIIPGVGAALVWIPAVIWLLISGHTGAAIGLGAWCAIVVGTVDNLLRPRLVGSDTKMSDLTILVSTLGGLAMFGAVGIVIGPLIAGLASTVWDIYGVEFAAILRQDE